MRLPVLVFALFISVCSNIFAQRQADWSAELNGNAQQIIFQYLTGVPIIQTEKAYIGINPESKKVAWTAERSAEQALSGIVETTTDFYNMNLTPYVLVRSNLIDSRDGKVLLDKETENYKRVEDYEVIPALNSVLIRTTAEGKLRLYLVNMSKNKVEWKVDAMKSGGIPIKTSSDSDEEESIDVPVNTTLLTPSKHLLYRNKKNLACIDAKTGELLWTEKANPAEVLLSPDGKSVLIIEAQSGGLMAMATAGSGAKMKDKKLIALDLLTGKEVWKDEIEAKENIRWVDTHPDFLTVVHKKGCNLYNYATGKSLWKRDFEERRIVEIQPNAEGYLVFFHSGYKSMQLSPEGKELWKKAKVKETEDGDTDVPEDGGLDRYEFAKGDILIEEKEVRFVPAKGSGMKRWSNKLDDETRVAYDDSRKNIIILTKKKMLIINPDNIASVALSMTIDVFASKDFHTLEIRKNSYFLTSQQEYILVWPSEDNKVAHKYYKKPFDGKGFLMNTAGAAMTVGSAAAGTSGIINANKGAAGAVGSSFGMMPPGSGETELRRANKQINAANTMADAASMMPSGRWEAFAQTRDHAYYFTKEKGDDESVKLLIKVSKDTGEEVDKLIFDDARPLYQIDEIQKRIYYANKGVLKVFNM